MKKAIGWSGIASPLIVFLLLSAWANSDLAYGRYCLDIDEGISVDQIRTIFQSFGLGLQAFTDSVLFGHEYRYGQIFFSLGAAVSAIPNALFGEKGLIIANRMLQACLLAGAYLTLSWVLIESLAFRLLAVLALVLLPFTGYYATMPKPEPLQLLFIAAFVGFWKRRESGLGWHWVLLGLATGTKVSAGPMALIFLGWDLFWKIRRSSLSALEIFLGLRRDLAVSTGAFLLGLMVAVPGLFIGKFQAWVNSTWLNSTHPSDNPSVGATDWLLAIGHNYGSSLAVVGIVGVLGLSILVWAMFRELRRVDAPSRHHPDLIAPALAVIAVLQGLVIVTSVKRVWGFYLHPAAVLWVVALLAISERAIAKGPRWMRLTTAAFLLLAAGNSIPALGRSSWMLYQGLAHRTSAPAFAARNEAYKKENELLELLSKRIQRPILVYSDSTLFMPEASSMLAIVPIWKDFHGWDESVELIVAGKNIPGPPERVLGDYLELQAPIAQSQRAYKEHVVAGSGQKCKEAPCFELVCRIADSIDFYVNQGFIQELKESECGFLPGCVLSCSSSSG